MTEEGIFELEDVPIKPSKTKNQKKQRLTKMEQTMPSLRDGYTSCNIRVKGKPEGEERKKRTGEIFEAMMTENFLELVSDTKPQIQKSQRTPSRIKAQTDRQTKQN